MAEVVITETPAAEPAASRDDAAFAHGEAVGRFESHMGDCMARHMAHEDAEAALESRLAAIESAASAAAAQASVATVIAVEAAADAADAQEEVEEVDEEPEVDVIEMEMPDIPTETTEEPKKSGGFHLW
jgi:hypothetical protein